MPQRLELLGRFELDPHTGGLDADEVRLRCVVPFGADARADPDGFLAELGILVGSSVDGFGALGAASLVWDYLGGRALRSAAALPIIDAGIDFKLARGLPTARLTGHEWERLKERRRAGF